MPKSFKQAYAETKLRTQKRINGFMSRRPHRSFRLTRRRDYARSLKLPGYFAFTHFVNRTLWRNWKMFLGLAIVYGLLSAFLVGMGSQETYTSLTNTLQETGAEVVEGDLDQLGQAGLLFASIATSGLTETPTEAQQIYAVLLLLLVWLTSVWLLRNILAGHKVRMRDGLYSAGAPLVPMFLVALVFILQLIPVGVAIVGYSAAAGSGLLESGIEAMMFWIAAAALTVLSLYWISATFFAMIIVTLPGMYPGRALKTAGDMVVGRRLRILLRMLWMVLCLALAWGLLTIPFILLDGWLKDVWPAIEWVPIIPIALLAIGAVSAIWSAAYVYLFYRRVVEDDAKPA